MNKLTLKINKNRTEELQRLALMFGLSLESFATKILNEVSASIGEESWNDCSAASKASFKRGLADFKAGRISSSL